MINQVILLSELRLTLDVWVFKKKNQQIVKEDLNFSVCIQILQLKIWMTA